MLRKRTWVILLVMSGAGVFGLLPARHSPAGLAEPAASTPDRLILPTLAPTSLHAATYAFALTAAATRPLFPTPSLAKNLIPTRTMLTTPTLPAIAAIQDIYGYGQLLSLSCEARSAADWARYYKIEVHELDFLKRLPKSANPEEGFVGSVNGGWGQVPPASYGVHAAPVAAVLQSYGASAVAMRNMTFTALKQKIAAGHPVIVWVAGHVAPGKGVPYEIDGRTVTVAAYEHTVIVTGFNDAQQQITFLDGKQVYQRPYGTFFASWGALENMAIIWEE